MESSLNQTFDVKSKHSSEEALRKWRRVPGFRKLRKRPFRINDSNSYDAAVGREDNQVLLFSDDLSADSSPDFSDFFPTNIRNVENSDDYSTNIIDAEGGWRKFKPLYAWIFLTANLGMEFVSAIFEQLASVHKPEYALVAMIMAFVGLLLSIVELFIECVKKGVRWDGEMCWFCYSSTDSPMKKRFGTFFDIFGLVIATLQSISGAIAYGYLSQHHDNPINVSFLPLAFAFGLLCFRYFKNRSGTEASATTTSAENDGETDTAGEVDTVHGEVEHGEVELAGPSDQRDVVAGQELHLKGSSPRQEEPCVEE